MAEAYCVRARQRTEHRPGEMLYAAMADSPEGAVALVCRLVAPGTELRATGERLSKMTAMALGLRPGQARAV